ncbi:Oidioi.mRNA.OKI2018_I69.chr2.g5287.t1.cds [Oikopleura dioica]|uniref:Oidioi.mRNA.OKI2018_I69.chr2.g5287.t1.cds n=1 Tax=Oikopleura dioica TaxID=34765 RepID=A0ABN7T5U0_OIKDI|nr:Oidioi.mRNA.OKI2018_I69.chr2.g5287.t1.cds [Oikopleura dioica]
MRETALEIPTYEWPAADDCDSMSDDEFSITSDMIPEESHATFYCATCGCGTFFLCCGLIGMLYFLGSPYYADEICFLIFLGVKKAYKVQKKREEQKAKIRAMLYSDLLSTAKEI